MDSQLLLGISCFLGGMTFLSLIVGWGPLERSPYRSDPLTPEAVFDETSRWYRKYRGRWALRALGVATLTIAAWGLLAWSIIGTVLAFTTFAIAFATMIHGDNVLASKHMRRSRP